MSTNTAAAPADNATVAQQQQHQSPAEQLAQRNRADEARLAFGQQREDLNSYAEAGIFYAAKAPVANALGAEVGFATRDNKTGQVQRSGFGLYLRSDHMCNLPYYGKVNI